MRMAAAQFGCLSGMLSLSRCEEVVATLDTGSFKEPGYLHTNLMAQLDAVERRAGVASPYATAPERFGHLLEALHEQAGRPVAVLVDEYDKPILEALETLEVARANR